MKRILSLLMLAFVLLLTACTSPATPETPAETPVETPDETGTEPTPAEPVTLKIAGLLGGYKDAHWKAIAEKFEAANEGVTVELTLEPNIHEILRPQLQAGNYPDIIYLAVGSVGGLTDTLIKEQQLLEITDFLDLEVPGEAGVKVKDKIIPSMIDNATVKPYGDGKLYLAPLFYAPTGFFYNANLVGEGKTYDLPTNFEEFLALGETAKADGISLFTYPTAGYLDGTFYGLLNAALSNEDYEKALAFDPATWQKDEVKAIFEFLGNVAEYVEPNTVANANSDGFKNNQQLVLDDKALFIPNGTWLPGEMAEAPRVDGFQWGLSALPATTVGGDQYSYTYSEQAYIPAEAENAELAKKFLAYLYSDEAAEIIYNEAGAVQPISGVEDIFEDDDINKVYYSVYETAKAATGGWVAAPAVEGLTFTDVLYEAYNSVVNGSKTAEQWYNEVVDAVTRLSEAISNQ